MDIVKLQQVGNGFYVSISKAYMDRLSLKKGDHMTVELTDRGLLVKPLKLEGEKEDEGTFKG